MEAIPLNIAGLVPKETNFTLSTRPNESFTLCRWSLRVRAWAITKYTPQNLKTIFEEARIDEIAEITWFMLKDKAPFQNDINNFLDSAITTQDQVNIIVAMLGAVGIGEPEMKEVSQSLEKKKMSPTPPTPEPPKKKKKTGAKSMTP